MTREEAIKLLVEHAKGREFHLFDGNCPDEVNGWDIRDAECPVCRALIVVEGKKANHA